MYERIIIGPYRTLDELNEEIEREISRLKKIYIFQPYITHYMYNMQKRNWDARITYLAIARHPNRK